MENAVIINKLHTVCHACMYTILCIQQCKCAIPYTAGNFREVQNFVFFEGRQKTRNYCPTCTLVFTCKAIGGCGFLVLKGEYSKMSAEGSI